MNYIFDGSFLTKVGMEGLFFHYGELVYLYPNITIDVYCSKKPEYCYDPYSKEVISKIYLDGNQIKLWKFETDDQILKQILKNIESCEYDINAYGGYHVYLSKYSKSKFDTIRSFHLSHVDFVNDLEKMFNEQSKTDFQKLLMEYEQKIITKKKEQEEFDSVISTYLELCNKYPRKSKVKLFDKAKEIIEQQIEK